MLTLPPFWKSSFNIQFSGFRMNYRVEQGGNEEECLKKKEKLSLKNYPKIGKNL